MGHVWLQGAYFSMNRPFKSGYSKQVSIYLIVTFSTVTEYIIGFNLQGWVNRGRNVSPTYDEMKGKQENRLEQHFLKLFSDIPFVPLSSDRFL